MRVCLVQPDTPSHALRRVERALVDSAPARVTLDDDASRADLLVIPVIGRHDSVARQVRTARKRGQRVALIQYCLRSTMREHTSEWLDLWEQAEAVWSYYDLAAMLHEDGVAWGDAWRLYHAPLGGDASVFTLPPKSIRPMVICASGRAWLTESARECAMAALNVDRRMVYLGPHFRTRWWVHSVSDLPDEALAFWYGACEFVSGLRRIEGFELPAVEGLLCGARPVLFDRPHYRHWFSDFADFIEERDRVDVIDDLTRLFAHGARPVTPEERARAVERFSWPRVTTGFWERL